MKAAAGSMDRPTEPDNVKTTSGDVVGGAYKPPGENPDASGYTRQDSDKQPQKPVQD